MTTHANANRLNAVSIAIDKALKMVLYLASNAIIARIVGPELFGSYSTLIATAVVFTVLSAAGLNALLVKEFVDSEHPTFVLTNAIYIRLQAAMIAAIVMITISIGVISVEFHNIIISAAIIPISVYYVLDSLFESKLKMHIVATYRILGYIVGFSAKIYVVLNCPSLFYLLLAHLVEVLAIFIGACISIVRTKTLPQIAKLDGAYRRNLLSRSWPLLLSSAAVILYMKIDQPLLYSMAGADEAGIYSSATRLCEALFIISAPIIITVFPRIVTLYNGPHDSYAAFMRLIFVTLVLLGIFVCIVTVVLADAVILLLYGPDFGPAADIMRIYALSIPIVYLGDLFSRWLIVSDNIRLSLYRHSLGLLVNVVLNLVLIPDFGAIGAAYASVFGYFSAIVLFAIAVPKARAFFGFLRPS